MTARTSAVPLSPPSGRPIRRPRLARGAVGLLGGLALLAGLPATVPSAAAQPPPPIYVGEDFTGATAPGFTGYGSACLTGAPADDDGPTTGSHPLGGCPTPSAVGGPVPPPGAAGNGYLQLTDAKTDQSGAALYNQAIPAGDGLVVTFEQWQYGPTAEFGGQIRPADGISFFLVDGTANLDAPGAFGGSLGYAQKNDPDEAVVPGVDQGYLGIGLDVLGNYFNDGEGRGSGCPADQRSPAGTAFPTPSSTGSNMVTVRGPGDGLEGYCWLGATYTGEHDAAGWESSLPGSREGPTTEVSGDPVQAEQDLEPSKRTVTVEITPAPDPVMTVWIDFQDGQGAQQVLSMPAPSPVPSTYKFGFAGSTGVWSNVHLIRNVVIGKPAPALGLDKSVSDGLPLPLEEGDTVPYTYTVTNTGNTRLDEVVVTDDRLGPITCPQTSLSPGESVQCTGIGTVTAADAERGELLNTATATATYDGQPVGPAEDSLSLPVRKTAGGSITINKVDAHKGKPLAGAVFELWRETNGVPGLQTRGDNTDTWDGRECSTDRQGVCTFADLADGIYYLLETKAPHGYRLPRPPVTGPLTIEGDEHLTKQIENTRGKHCKDKHCEK
ncbi:SpaA isopeptide-forming pilin-related protein [Streptomyces sp. BSP1]|uniref:DUF7507 domain-containing protein n=1 Tax=Streptomyces sp. BSP1 TaxID=2944804 RepID=UPI00211DC9B3|nr:SpaA isopeptide-forming pilin-related protein [Streptomyces sp. BSP1]MCQ9705930.1 SpaA isopeptide-forming pilin-related protein [Streptomyces sp. BSP1]